MSADNAIYIQQRLDGRYWVWMGFVSSDVNEPDPEKDYSYETKAEALAHAAGWAKEIMFLEYGIQLLEPQVSVMKSPRAKMQLCNRVLHGIGVEDTWMLHIEGNREEAQLVIDRLNELLE